VQELHDKGREDSSTSKPGDGSFTCEGLDASGEMCPSHQWASIMVSGPLTVCADADKHLFLIEFVQAVPLGEFAHNGIFPIMDGAHSVLEQDGVPSIADASNRDECQHNIWGV